MGHPRRQFLFCTRLHESLIVTLYTRKENRLNGCQKTACGLTRNTNISGSRVLSLKITHTRNGIKGHLHLSALDHGLERRNELGVLRRHLCVDGLVVLGFLRLIKSSLRIKPTQGIESPQILDKLFILSHKIRQTDEIIHCNFLKPGQLDGVYASL